MTTSSDLRVCGNRHGSLLQFVRFGFWLWFVGFVFVLKEEKSDSANEMSELLAGSSLRAPQHLNTASLRVKSRLLALLYHQRCCYSFLQNLSKTKPTLKQIKESRRSADYFFFSPNYFPGQNLCWLHSTEEVMANTSGVSLTVQRVKSRQQCNKHIPPSRILRPHFPHRSHSETASIRAPRRPFHVLCYHLVAKVRNCTPGERYKPLQRAAPPGDAKRPTDTPQRPR